MPVATCDQQVLATGKVMETEESIHATRRRAAYLHRHQVLLA